MHVVCQYFSKRTGKTEWRRGTAMVKMNLGNFKIDLFDHGVIATVHFRLEGAIKEIRSFKPPFFFVDIKCCELEDKGRLGVEQK